MNRNRDAGLAALHQTKQSRQLDLQAGKRALSQQGIDDGGERDCNDQRHGRNPRLRNRSLR